MSEVDISRNREVINCLDPEGIAAISPGSLRSSAPGVSVPEVILDPGGVAANTPGFSATPSGSYGSLEQLTPGALLPQRPGANSLDPFGIRQWSRIGFIAVISFAAISSFAIAAEPLPRETNSLGMNLVLIPAGEFNRGMTDEHKLRTNHPNTLEQGADLTDERPAHPVKLTKPFWLATHEVTVGQFRKFVEATKYQTTAEKSGRGALVFNPAEKEGVNRFVLKPDCTWRSPGFVQTDDHPVTCISWQDAVAFCEWLSKEENATYHLPTEAEWEYAARAGSDTIYVGGDAPSTVYAHGNIGDAALEAAHPGTVKRQHLTLTPEEQLDGVVYTAPVGKFKPNTWGLFDTHGNVWEWCSDRYYDRYYPELHKAARDPRSGKLALTIDPRGPETTPQHKYGDWRSMRGGCWYTGPMASRSASRAYGEASDAFCYAGFRVVRDAK